MSSIKFKCTSNFHIKIIFRSIAIPYYKLLLAAILVYTVSAFEGCALVFATYANEQQREILCTTLLNHPIWRKGYTDIKKCLIGNLVGFLMIHAFIPNQKSVLQKVVITSQMHFNSLIVITL